MLSILNPDVFELPFRYIQQNNIILNLMFGFLQNNFENFIFLNWCKPKDEMTSKK
jgi:hypothetical protein